MPEDDVVASNEAALEVVPLSIDALAAGTTAGGVMDQCESEPPPEGYGDSRVGQGHGLTDSYGLKPVASSRACAGANAGLVPKREGAGTFLDQVVVEGFMKMFGHVGLEVVRITLHLGRGDRKGSEELFTDRRAAAVS
ncbi:unnamed protein product, partial [Heterosigma akashiwo]